MIIRTGNINYNIDKVTNKSDNSGNVILLHGFTGSAKDWEDIIPELNDAFNYFSVDLIGHGNTDSPVESELYTPDSLVSQLKEITAEITNDRFVLIGYSMGGRAALSFAVKYPELLNGLILESSTAGIKDINLREERIKEDEKIADFIDNHSLEEFIEFWKDRNIFNTQKRFSNEKLDKIKNSRMLNNKTGLANSLKGFGTGNFTPIYDKLVNIKCKTLLITGELDEKFTNINKEMLGLFPNAHHRIIKNAGHNTHLEVPKIFIREVNSFLEAL